MTATERLEALGERRRELIAELDQLTEQIADAVRDAREEGRTLQQLVQLSGYAGVSAIQRILDPDMNERINKGRRKS